MQFIDQDTRAAPGYSMDSKPKRPRQTITVYPRKDPPPALERDRHQEHRAIQALDNRQKHPSNMMGKG